MKRLEKNKAVELRKQGMTLGEILKEVPVSKGSLSNWLKDIILTRRQAARIKYKNDQIRLNFIKFNKLRKKRAEDNRKIIVANAASEIGKITKKELKLIGIALYWAEGYKRNSHWQSVSFTNSDPEMIKWMMNWFRIICGVSEGKFRVRIQCHGSEKIEECMEYWSSVTGVSLSQFTEPYSRISPTSQRKAVGVLPHGICEIRISDTSLLNKIRGWIQGLMALSSSPV